MENHIRFAAIVLLSPLRVLQRKAIRIVARAKFNVHTDNIFKELSILKFDDIVQLNLTLFVHHFKNKQLPISFNNCLENLPPSEQVFRYHDYNLKFKNSQKTISFILPDRTINKGLES